MRKCKKYYPHILDGVPYENLEKGLLGVFLPDGFNSIEEAVKKNDLILVYLLRDDAGVVYFVFKSTLSRVCKRVNLSSQDPEDSHFCEEVYDGSLLKCVQDFDRVMHDENNIFLDKAISN